MSRPEPGETHTVIRTFDADDVDAFAAVTGDDQPQHTEVDDAGRRMVQGLLTGSLLTDIGGDLDMLARSMEFHFVRPVYTGDTLRCVWENRRVDERPDAWDVTARVSIERLAGKGAGGTPGGAPSEPVGDGGAPAAEPAAGDTGAPDVGLPPVGEGEAVIEATVDGLVRK